MFLVQCHQSGISMGVGILLHRPSMSSPRFNACYECARDRVELICIIHLINLQMLATIAFTPLPSITMLLIESNSHPSSTLIPLAYRENLARTLAYRHGHRCL
jgi:hypothetical protein